MKELLDTLKKHDLRTNKYKTIGHATIIDSNKGRLVLKEKQNQDIYNYLDSRSFNYYPKMINDDKYQIMEYQENTNMPKEQKMLDLINLVSLLHNKTTFYQNVDEDDYKKIYEDLKNNIDYLFNYYNDLMTVIESRVFMAPDELLLARNISIVFAALNYSSVKLDEWLDSIKDKHRKRYAVIHNNLSLDHFIKNKNAYLISWDKSRIDSPIYDIYKLYKDNAMEYDFKDILKAYNKNYPLLEEEKNLFYILISIPDKIELNDTMYNNSKKISNLIDYLYKTEELISPNNSENTK